MNVSRLKPHRKPTGVFHGRDDERRGVLPVLLETRAEHREQALGEGVREAVEVQPGLHVVERDLAALVIQEHAHFAGRRRQRQREAERRQRLDLAVLQPQAPVAALGAQLDLALAAGRGGGHAQRPRRLAPQVHLPVVAPGAQALAAQDEEGGAKALGPLRVDGLALFVPHLAAVLGHGQVLLGRGRVQDHLA
ncbi:hypothetical protein EYF80_049150 [Liparis tanakae]|uniref:Uncharacterized protein n=1 Tax=Liparis tanakae TaxID=230148 RepID=A0A4Z2FIB3_9TELE|nr:hypothetical protein EYF80_049150 [Liparis tanakae]